VARRAEAGLISGGSIARRDWLGVSCRTGACPTGEAGICRQDISWGTGEIVCVPSLDLVPEDRQLSHHMDRPVEDISSIEQLGGSSFSLFFFNNHVFVVYSTRNRVER